MQVNIFDGYAVYAIRNNESTQVDLSVPVVEPEVVDTAVSQIIHGLGG